MKEGSLTDLFEAIPKAQWISKIEADLKGQDRHDLFEKIAGDWKIDPFVHSEDLPEAEVNDLSFDRVGHAIPLQPIEVEDPYSANSDILHHLRNGAGSLLLKGNVINSLDHILENVDTDLAPVFSHDDLKGTRQVSDYIFVLQPGDRLIDQVVLWMTDLYQSERSGIITAELTDHIYHNITALRALRVLHDQLMSDLERDLSLTILADYQIDQSQDLAYNLQTSMPKVLAAILGGANHILSPRQIEVKDARWYHNLVHLLTLEAGLPLEKDLICGSFYLEKLTNQIADRAWDRFVNSFNNQ